MDTTHADAVSIPQIGENGAFEAVLASKTVNLDPFFAFGHFLTYNRINLS